MPDEKTLAATSRRSAPPQDRVGPEVVAPTNRVNVALPFSHLRVEERSKELAELSEIVSELAGVVAQLSPASKAKALRARAEALASRTKQGPAAKLEWHQVGSTRRLLCVHRKGATRALPPGHAELPADLRRAGQPVLVPGSMGTASYVLVGCTPGGAFASACHGAGRTMSRHHAAKQVSGSALRAQLEGRGIAVRAASARGLAEEAPFAYKDVDEVVGCCEHGGLARRVVRLRPLGVVKG